MALIDVIGRYLPAWLTSYPGQETMETVAGAIDVMTEGVYQARDHLIGVADSADALPLIGRDRSLVPGLLETPASFRDRGSQWRPTWRTSGSVYTLLDQIANVWGPDYPRVRMVWEYGWATGPKKARWVTRNPDGTFQNYTQSPSNFNWDGQDLPQRAFIILYIPTTPEILTEGVWGMMRPQLPPPPTTWYRPVPV